MSSRDVRIAFGLDTWKASLIGACIILALIMQGPQFLRSLHPLSEGLPVHLNSDEAIYIARVQQALIGDREQVAEAFVGESDMIGTQFAFIESIYGHLFSWTNLRAPELLTIMDSIIPPLILLSLTWFLMLCGFGRWKSLWAAIAFCMILLYSMNRPIHMRTSFLLMLWSLIGITYATRGNRFGTLVGGLLLGTLMKTYVWTFFFGWAWWGAYTSWEILMAKIEKKRTHWKMLIATGVIGLLATLPTVLSYVRLSREPLYELGSFRSGMFHSRMPESIVYSALFTIMLASTLVVITKRRKQTENHAPAFVTIIAAFVFMHQHIVHGISFNFVSHGIYSMLTAALCMTLLALTLKTKESIIGGIAACIYMAGLLHDNKFIFEQWKTHPNLYRDQHLAAALPLLDDLPRSRILSDAHTSWFVSGFTHHDVAYSIYLKNILVTHEEIARRFCLTQLPIPPEERRIERVDHLVYPDATRAFGGDLREKEVAMVRRECEFIEEDHARALETYDIDYILWNKRRRDDWDIDRLNVDVRAVASGDEWILYEYLPHDDR